MKTKSMSNGKKHIIETKDASMTIEVPVAGSTVSCYHEAINTLNQAMDEVTLHPLAKLVTRIAIAELNKKQNHLLYLEYSEREDVIEMV